MYEIAGCKDDIEGNIENMPYGNKVLTFILPCGYDDIDVMDVSDGNFLVIRDYGVTPFTEDYMPYPISYGGKTYGFYYKISPIICACSLATPGQRAVFAGQVEDVIRTLQGELL